MNAIRVRQAWVIVMAACLITGLAMSLRQVLGLYLRPVTMDLGIGREPFSNAMALANLVWGFGAILFGFLVTLTNPKAIVLFASVFATAVTASTPTWLMVLMIGLVTTSSLVWYSCVSLFMSSGPVMRRFQRARHWIERAAGVCFIGLGGKVLADAGRPVSL